MVQHPSAGWQLDVILYKARFAEGRFGCSREYQMIHPFKKVGAGFVLHPRGQCLCKGVPAQKYFDMFA